MRKQVFALASVVGLLALSGCSRSGEIAESPDRPMTPASRFETRGQPEQRAVPVDRTADPEIAPSMPEPEPTPAPRNERDVESGTEVDVDEPPMPSVPESELPPSSGAEPDRKLNWIDDSGNTVQ